MRLYTFINMYLSSIQQGIQTAHIVAELYNKYKSLSPYLYDDIKEWAADHKTIIVLNGGPAQQLERLIEIFKNDQNFYPWAVFNESGEALHGALTGVGIILPERTYGLSAAVAEEEKKGNLNHSTHCSKFMKTHNINPWELDLLMELNRYSLAR